MKVLITGRSGVGKSTIYRELTKRSLPAIDSDRVVGLCAWRNPYTNIIVAVDSSQPIDKQKAAWTWDKSVFRQLLNENSDIFICGGADNQLQFYDLFDIVFVLNVPEDVQRQRMMSRTEHDYGSQPALQAQIIKEQKQLIRESVAFGAILLDALPHPKAIVTKLLEHIHAN